MNRVRAGEVIEDEAVPTRALAVTARRLEVEDLRTVESIFEVRIEEEI